MPAEACGEPGLPALAGVSSLGNETKFYSSGQASLDTSFGDRLRTS
jgi:hypothetical protein